MKMSKIIALLLVVVMLVASFAACKKNDEEEKNPNADLAGTYDVTLWVSEKDGVADQFKEQIAAFEAANPGIKINASIEGVTEADAGSKVVADVASAPDIFCFAQDQLARLVQASALLAPGKAASETIRANNDAGSVAAATVGGTLYAYPMTSDNGYYLYYDKSIISNPDSLEDIIKACEDNEVKFRFALENAWYTASFFFATGCHSNWTTNSDGEFVSVDDNFNSLEGMIAMKGMQKLAQSTCYDSYTDIFIDAFADAGAIVTGIWNAGLAREHFGDNLGAADLPSFTVDGKSYHLGSYSGHKLIGVKPQSDAKKAEVLALLAQYLTGTECQMERYNEFNLTPSNIDAQNSDVFKADVHSSALVAQNEYATPQGNIAAVYWDTAKLLGAVAKNATNDVDLQMGLDDYKEAVDDFVKFTPEQRNSYTVIGDVNGTMWDTDFEMVKGEDGSWVSKDVFDLAVGDEFKVRFGMDWKVAYGNNEDNANTSIGLNSKGNYIVETAGRYYIKIVVNEDTTAVITLVPAE